MILHCMICSAGGTHISSDTAIGVVDMEKLDLPLDSLMFTSLMPERELPPPWQLGAGGWKNMKCPRGNHLPWGIELDKTDQAMENGGPKQILTDEGFVETKKPEKTGVWEEPEIDDITKKKFNMEASQDEQKFKNLKSTIPPDDGLFKCDCCPKADIKSLAGKMAHERHCKKKGDK